MLWAYARWARLADGPDSAHRHQVGREELKKGAEMTRRHAEYMRKSRELAVKYGVELVTMPEDAL